MPAPEEKQAGTSTTDDGSAVLGEEEDTSRSLAATLRLAAAKGYIDKRKATVVISNAKKTKLEAKSYTIEEKKEESRGRNYGGNSSSSSSSRPGRSNQHQVSSFKDPEDYKPEINLEYTDDSGRKLETQKEAFRYLCHKFHGKGPGKNKIDKRLRKQALESKLKQSQSTDGLTPSASLMISKQKELNSPYIVLSKGK